MSIVATETSPAPLFKKKTHPGRIGFGILIALLYLFLLAPLIIVLVISFQSNLYLSFPPEGFTLRWYAELPRRTEAMRWRWAWCCCSPRSG